MRSPEFAYMMAAMFAVPLASWIAGRLAGRGNHGVGAMLICSLLVSLLVQGALLFDFSLIMQTGRAPQRDMMLGGLEFAGFLFVFGGFLTLLGWAGTPARLGKQ